MRIAATVLVPLAAPFALIACISVESATMKAPDGFDQAERVVIEGTWPNRKGQVTAGAYSGDYAWAYDGFDLSPGIGYESESGRTRFAVTGPDGTSVSARCEMRERTVTYGRRGRDGSVTTETELGVKVSPVSYECRLTRDGSDAGRMTLREDALSLQNIIRYKRRGQVEYDGVRLDLTSIHAIAGSPIGNAMPTGYTISSGGKVIAAVDTLQPDPVMLVAQHAPPTMREVLTATAIALALFKDPA